MRHIVALSFALTCALSAQVLQNADFEQGAAGAAPVGWWATAGSGVWTAEGCTEGKGCVEAAPPASSPNPGILLQSIDAAPYRGKTIRLRGAVRVTAGGRAAMWIRVDRPDRQTGFFDNMGNRPIVLPAWSQYQIDGFVHADAEKIVLGLLVFSGKAVLDDIRLEVVGDLPAMQ